VTFVAPANAPSNVKGIVIKVHYEMYVGAPIISKWISVHTNMTLHRDLVISGMTVEYVSLNQDYAPISTEGDTLGRLYVTTTIPHGSIVTWQKEFNASAGAYDPVLVVNYTMGPSVRIKDKSSSFTSFRAILLVTDTLDLERHSLSRHRMTRLLTPQTQENPIFFHAVNTTQYFELQIRQMKELGFEMLIYSFDSQFHMENTTKEYLEYIRGQVQFAKSMGIEVGAYDLICQARGHGTGNIKGKFPRN
jgi:hypothetical protein